ncbi:hypothetical protein LCGC14_0871860 [marine sediment metagenome]|uniref:Uncharacterized protein n=1 Tax=marine sediment metagenome TaxID=412755 RepID=A0A0F9RP17_9ZZZZ
MPNATARSVKLKHRKRLKKLRQKRAELRNAPKKRKRRKSLA